MQKTIRGIFIDAENKTVTEVNIEPTLSEFYRLIKCELIEGCYPRGLAKNHFLYVDEEGLYNQKHFFKIDGFEGVLAGNALIFSGDNEGETISCTMSVDSIKERVQFGTVVELQKIILDRSSLN